MIRRIISIDEEKCNGCGLCARACHEGAIGMVEGKAKLLRDDYCDGLGDCLPACPMNAISFIEREAAPYDELAVLANKVRRVEPKIEGSCLSSSVETVEAGEGCLANFPVQIRLVPVNAPWFQSCDLLIAADCTAFACGSFHGKFMKDKVTVIGCPKLDNVSYAEKLAEIFSANDIRSITVARMTVPCCGGLPFAVKKALELSGKDIPMTTVIIRPDGTVAE